jgi:hypothetical protein
MVVGSKFFDYAGWRKGDGRTSPSWGFAFSGGGVRSEGTGKTLIDCGVK